MIDYLDAEDVLKVASRELARRQQALVVLDEGLLLSAVAQPQQSLFGEDAYPTLEDKAAVLLRGLARNHALGDGNKRTAMACAEVFLNLNDIELSFTEDEGVNLTLAVAKGELDVPEVAEWFRHHRLGGLRLIK